MSILVIVSIQWGDAGKDKVVALLARGTAVIIRFQGGSNAGYTLVVSKKTIKRSVHAIR